MNLKKPLKLRLYFVTPPIGEDEAHFVWLIQEAILGGVTMVQLRDKESSKERICKVAVRIHPFLKAHGVPLIINDAVDVALDIGAEGVHLGSRDMPLEHARAILGAEAILGFSLENGKISIPPEADYIAASPLFITQTKGDCGPPWGLEGLSSLRSLTTVPLVVIGGINVHHIAKIAACGADGVAVISAIADAKDPRSAARLLYDAWGKQR